MHHRRRVINIISLGSQRARAGNRSLIFPLRGAVWGLMKPACPDPERAALFRHKRVFGSCFPKVSSASSPRFWSLMPFPPRQRDTSCREMSPASSDFFFFPSSIILLSPRLRIWKAPKVPTNYYPRGYWLFFYKVGGWRERCWDLGKLGTPAGSVRRLGKLRV